MVGEDKEERQWDHGGRGAGPWDRAKDVAHHAGLTPHGAWAVGALSGKR